MPENGQTTTGQPTDLELISAARQGDAGAFPLLADRYRSMLQSRSRRYSAIIGVDREDFFQEGLLALFRAVQSFNPDSGAQFRTYAFTCVQNAMSTAIRKHWKNTQPGTTVDLGEIDKEPRSSTKPVEDIYLDMEAMSLRARQIETLLSNFERHVLKLYLGGQSYQQISDVLSTSTKAVDNALQRVRRKLRSSDSESRKNFPVNQP